MKINKFKKVGKNKYKVFFDNNEIILFEDIILKYNLLVIKDVNLSLLNTIIEENKFYEAYDSVLSYIEIKMRNKKEIINYLKRKNYSEKLINDVLDKLISLNLLNDEMYVNAFINDKTNLSNDGPYKIKKTLLELSFNEELIDKYLECIDNSVWINKLEKLINKKKNIMKTKSYYMFVTKIKNDLYNLGYDKSMIESLLSNIKYESDALKKDYEKSLKKYNDKNKIFSYLLRKGYSYDEISSLIK